MKKRDSLKRVSFILVLSLLLSLMNTFAYSSRNIDPLPLNINNNVLLRDNRYYYTISHDNERNYIMTISEDEARNEKIYEDAIKLYATTALGVYGATFSAFVGFVMLFYNGYNSAGDYYITKSTCKRIRHDRLTGEEKVVDIGNGFEISHSGVTRSRDFWY
ncbi:hypothetical protein [uncultured Peptoniphilus sp.]|uniref:hypothetical protein n=1 Tax=uncultured Peptoniphilus sp. TaxID=254354 RepID=UPI0028065087|nr:hypothetical protein [uncultured Peptoniphilus sp.]